MKILPLGAKFFRTDGRTDKHGEPNGRCLKFYDCLKK